MTDSVIERAGVADVDQLAPLFDAYRQFYNQPADLPAAQDYLTKRLEADDCAVFMARQLDGRPLGFTLLYPSFCSVQMAPAFVLYDLFVTPDARRSGVGEALLGAAVAYGRAKGAVWLRLETAHSNTVAQALYRKTGWELDDEFHAFFFDLTTIDASG